ncbi:MAG: hypothetical protein K6E47_09715, partial [Lachnospiraceae bacterium]|nr:hypothetical protein [Lachnospiraceae bacterium]
VGIVGKSKSLDFPTMLIFWSLVRNSVVLAVYLLFSVACFLTVHEHCYDSAMCLLGFFKVESTRELGEVSDIEAAREICKSCEYSDMG